MKDCIFCKIAQGEIKSDFIEESNNFFAIYDLHPKAKGHILVIPKKHFTTLLDIPKNLGEELLGFLKSLSSKVLEEKYGDGFNLIMNNLEPAGQEIPHAHFHIIPRNDDDGLKIIS